MENQDGRRLGRECDRKREGETKQLLRARKDRREKLRETMLRFHPDKFEGRIMGRVCDSDRELVKEAVGIVARTINALMGEAK